MRAKHRLARLHRDRAARVKAIGVCKLAEAAADGTTGKTAQVLADVKAIAMDWYEQHNNFAPQPTDSAFVMALRKRPRANALGRSLGRAAKEHRREVYNTLLALDKQANWLLKVCADAARRGVRRITDEDVADMEKLSSKLFGSKIDASRYEDVEENVFSCADYANVRSVRVCHAHLEQAAVEELKGEKRSRNIVVGQRRTMAYWSRPTAC